MRRILLMAWVFLACLQVANAQLNHRDGRKPHAKNPEMRKEIRAYTEKNILPALHEQRAKFDAFLSNEEKATINEMRAKFKAEKEAMHEKRKAFHKAKKEGGADIEKLKAEVKAQREKHKTDAEKLRTIAQKHDAEMQKLHTEIAPKMETWKADLEKIAAKYLDKEELEHMKQHTGKHWQKKGIAFLLMPTEVPQKKGGTRVEVFPNPAQETQAVKVTMKEAGALRIELFDRKGNRLQTVFEGTKPAGEHTFQVDTAQLPAGNYTYRIDTPAGKITQKLVVKK